MRSGSVTLIRPLRAGEFIVDKLNGGKARPLLVLRAYKIDAAGSQRVFVGALTTQVDTWDYLPLPGSTAKRPRNLSPLCSIMVYGGRFTRPLLSHLNDRPLTATEVESAREWMRSHLF